MKTLIAWLVLLLVAASPCPAQESGHVPTDIPIDLNTLSQEERQFFQAAHDTDPTPYLMRTRPTVCQIVETGNNATEVRTAGPLTEAALVMIYALGEAEGEKLVDYGWLENTTTGRVVWRMEYANTVPGGGDARNRKAVETLWLEPGTYRLHFVTNGAHAYPEWQGEPPERELFYGVTVFNLAGIQAVRSREGYPEDEGRSPRYAELIQEADALYESGDYALSTERFAEAFQEEGTPSLNDLYNAACSASLSGQVGRAYAYLHRAFEGGWRTFVNLGIDPDLKAVREQTKLFAEIKQRFREVLGEGEGDAFNKELAVELEDLYIRDQGIRYEWRALEARFPEGIPDSLNGPFMERWEETDAANLERVTAIIDKVGWPGKSMVGGTGAAAVFLVIQHADLEVQETYLPLLKKAVEQGEARASSMALMIDRVRMYKGEPQIYGSQIVKNDAGEWVFHPIEDLEQVNERRAEVGLGTIEDYAERMGVPAPHRALDRAP